MTLGRDPRRRRVRPGAWCAAATRHPLHRPRRRRRAPTSSSTTPPSPRERLNPADTVKVQWQAYLGEGALLLSDLGRVLPTIIADTSGRPRRPLRPPQPARPTRPGTATARPTAPPGARDLLALAAARHDLGRRDLDRRHQPLRAGPGRRRRQPRTCSPATGAPGARRAAGRARPRRARAVNAPPARRATDYTVRPGPHHVVGGGAARSRPVPGDHARAPAGVREHRAVRRRRPAWVARSDGCARGARRARRGRRGPGRLGRRRPPGETLRIVDLGGNQAVDCLLYNADDHVERYSAADTIAAQRNIFLVTGSVLRSNEGNPMMTVTATTCDRTTTPSAGRAAGSRTRCATATTRSTSTPASTTSSTPARATGWASATSCRTSTGS